MTAGGRTYERSAILAFWESRGQPLDPLSNQVLEDARLITNFDKRGEVHNFLQQNSEYIPEGWPDRDIPPPANVQALFDENWVVEFDWDAHFLVRVPWRRPFFFFLGGCVSAMIFVNLVVWVSLLFLRSIDPSINFLSFREEYFLWQASSNPEALVELLIDSTDRGQQRAAQALGQLAANSAHRQKVVKAGAIEHLVWFVKNGAVGSRGSAAAALSNLLAGDDFVEAVLGFGALEPLVQLLRNGTTDECDKASMALYNVARGEHRTEVAKAGGIEPVVQLLSANTARQRAMAARLIRLLAMSNENRFAVIKAGAVQPLFQLAKANTSAEQEAATGALLALKAISLELFGWSVHVSAIFDYLLIWMLYKMVAGFASWLLYLWGAIL